MSSILLAWNFVHLSHEISSDRVLMRSLSALLFADRSSWISFLMLAFSSLFSALSKFFLRRWRSASNPSIRSSISDSRRRRTRISFSSSSIASCSAACLRTIGFSSVAARAFASVDADRRTDPRSIFAKVWSLKNADCSSATILRASCTPSKISDRKSIGELVADDGPAPPLMLKIENIRLQFRRGFPKMANTCSLLHPCGHSAVGAKQGGEQHRYLSRHCSCVTNLGK